VHHPSNLFSIRDATARDIPGIAGIYRRYVLDGLASFEIEPPEPEELDQRRAALQDRGYPYYVAERDGRVAGYAYAAPYRPRVAYRHTVEDSIYVSADAGRQGIGSALLDRLIADCTDLGYRQMIAVIGDSANTGSIRVHEKAGFARVGFLPSIGFKLDQWVDSILMQRPLGEGDITKPA